MENYKIINIEQKFKSFLKVTGIKLKQKLPNGEWSKEFNRELIERGHAAAALIRDPNTDTLLFTKQLRVGALKESNPYIIELVAGMIDDTENPEKTVIRESEEETGVTDLKNIEFISTYFPSPGACSEKVSLFYAEADLSNVNKWGGCPSENEVIEVITIKTDEAFVWLKEGKLNTSINQISLFWLMTERLQGRKI